MNLEQHQSRDDMKVWLSQDELEELLQAAKDSPRQPTEKYLAVALGGLCGLRSHEILDVAPKDVVDTDSGIMLRVHHGKGDKYRETPCPELLAERVRTIDDVRSEDDSTPLVSVKSTRSLRRWIKDCRERVRERTGDEMWKHVSTHDLRRTWAGQLRRADVDAMIVCSWGGWNDLETFIDHYKGEDTPEAQRRERQKVDWL